MIQELLVIIACTQNSGCSPTTSAYYSEHPVIKQNIRNSTNTIKTLVGPTAVSLSPFVLFAVKQKATINITKYVSLQIDGNRDKLILLQFSY